MVRSSRHLTSISILGSGTVGTALGTGLLKLGHRVILYDTDKRRIRSLGHRGLEVTSCINDAVNNSQVSFICVPTPTSSGKIDLSNLEDVVRSLAKCLREKSDYHLVVVKSTVTPGTAERIVIPLLERYSGKRVGRRVGVCMNPEFLTEIHRSWSHDPSFARGFSSERMTVIGESDKKSGDYVERIYRPLRVPIIRTNLRTAETIKYAFNCALASRISYWNEIYYICQMIGVDSEVVARTAALDERIGEYGTVHGKAFGGKCLPKDLKALIRFAKDLKYEPKLLEAVEDINTRIRKDRGVRE